MADVTISGIATEATTVGDDDWLEVEQGGASMKAKVSKVRAAAPIKVTATVTSGTITPDANTDVIRPAALTAALTVANPASAPQDGWSMVVELKDDGTARALTWGSQYTGRIGTLPTTTTAGKWHVIVVSYNATDSKMYCDMAEVQA